MTLDAQTNLPWDQALWNVPDWTQQVPGCLPRVELFQQDGWSGDQLDSSTQHA